MSPHRRHKTARLLRRLDRTLFEASEVAMLLVDPADEGRIVDANGAAARLYGWDRDELRRRRMSELSTMPAADVADRMALALRRAQTRFRFAHRLASGEERDVEIASGPVTLDGRELLLSIVHGLPADDGAEERARTAYEAAEAERERLVAAVNQSSEAIVITDANARIVYVNPAFEKVSGYTRAEALGENPRILRSGRQDAAFYREMWTTLASGQSWTGEFVNRRRDGTEYEEEAVISPIRDSRGRTVAYVAVKRDVGRERALEAQLRQAHKMEAVGRLAGGVAHDFNNLLTAIGGYAALATMRAGAMAGEAELAHDLEEIQRAVERAAGLTRQLLAFSRRAVLQPRVLDPNEVIASVVPMLTRLIGEDISLVVEPGDRVGRVRADAGQLEQVIVNLAVNARDAMPAGGTLTIRTANVRAAELPRLDEPSLQGGCVVLAVSDTGLGMDEATLERAFEPFFTTKDRGHGTGLGLATVFGIVQQAKGKVQVESAPGAGSTFQIYLPRVEEPAGDGPDAAVRSAAAGPERRRQPRETILVVEDEEAVRGYAVRVLERAGYRVLAAVGAAAASAIEKTHDGPIEMLFTDVVMPGTGGPELARQLVGRRPGLRVLYASGYAEELLQPPDDGGSTPPGGAGGQPLAFVSKPYAPEELLVRIRELLGTAPPVSVADAGGVVDVAAAPGATTRPKGLRRRR